MPPSTPSGEKDPGMSSFTPAQQRRIEIAQRKAARPWWQKKRFILPLAFVAFMIFIMVRIGGEDSSQTATPGPAPATTTSQAAEDEPAEEPTQDEPQAAGLKDPVASGDLEFTVNSIKCGIRKVGPAGFEDRPQGQFCRLNIRVENIGDEEQQVFGEEQKLIDNQDREHTLDAGATIAANDEGSGDLWIGNINPGNVIKGDIVYDIPKDAKPVEVQLRGGLFEDAVTVELK